MRRENETRSDRNSKRTNTSFPQRTSSRLLRPYQSFRFVQRHLSSSSTTAIFPPFKVFRPPVCCRTSLLPLHQPVVLFHFTPLVPQGTHGSHPSIHLSVRGRGVLRRSKMNSHRAPGHIHHLRCLRVQSPQVSLGQIDASHPTLPRISSSYLPAPKLSALHAPRP